MIGRILVLALGLLGASVAQAALVDRIAAVVDDEVIALSEIYELGGTFVQQQCSDPSDATCRRRAELEVLDSLILQVLIRQELQELDLDVGQTELDRAIDQIIRENALQSRERLRREVEKSGISWETYRDQLEQQLRQMQFRQAIIRPRISISDDELRDLYQRSSRDYAQKPTATIEAITLPVPSDGGEQALVDTVGEARAIRQAVVDGELAWEQAVEEHHSGMLTGADGRMPPVEQGDLMPALDTVVFDTEPGTVAEPVVVRGVVFLVKVLEVEGSGVAGFDEVKDQLRERLYAEKMDEQIKQWFEQARRQASVRVLLEEPDDLDE